MSLDGTNQPESPPGRVKRVPPAIPKPRHLRGGSQSSSSSTAAAHTAVFSKFLMNDIQRGTSYSALMNSLLAPTHVTASGRPEKPQSHVHCSLVMSDSRLDDELSVAKIEFSDTPRWLRELQDDPTGFPKKTKLGTLWNMPDLSARDADGKTEFMRAVIRGKARVDLFYPEMLAEFAEVDVNVQDATGRTALHWACDGGLEDMVRLCLSVPDCDVGLQDSEGLTAFDIALRGSQEVIPALFYSSAMEIEQSDPQSALLRVLTFTDPVGDAPVFPGAAIFDPIESRNVPLVAALLKRRVDLTARNEAGNTPLHVAAAQVGTAAIATKLLEAGADITAIGMGGGTPLHHAAATADEEMVLTLLHWNADPTATDTNGRTPLQCATGGNRIGVAKLLEDYPAREPTGKSPADQRGSAIETEQQNDELDSTKQPVITGLAGDGLQDVLKRGNVDTTDVLELRSKSSADRLVSLESAAAMNERKDRLALIKTQILVVCGTEEITGDFGSDALRNALISMDRDTTEVLLELGVDKDSKVEGMPMLLVAAKRGFNAGVEILLAAGANIHASDKEKIYTALHLAAKYGQHAVVETLLAAGAGTEYLARLNSDTALQLAAQFGRNAVVQTLLAAGAVIMDGTGSYSHGALQLAAENGHNAVVETLLANGANIEAVSGSPSYRALHLAAESGHNAVVQTLLANGANIEAVSGSLSYRALRALHLAAENGHNAVVETLLSNGANIEAGSGTNSTRALHLAAHCGHNTIVETLLAAGADIEAARVIDLSRALHLAVEHGRVAVVGALLAAGADIEAARGIDSSRSLHLAVECRQNAVVETLLAAGADIEAARAIDSSRALHLAAEKGHADVVEILLAAGADVDGAKSDTGSTALHEAARNRNLAVIEKLLEAGANANALATGKTPRQVASRNGYTDIAMTLRNYETPKATWPWRKKK